MHYLFALPYLLLRIPQVIIIIIIRKKIENIVRNTTKNRKYYQKKCLSDSSQYFGTNTWYLPRYRLEVLGTYPSTDSRYSVPDFSIESPRLESGTRLEFEVPTRRGQSIPILTRYKVLNIINIVDSLTLELLQQFGVNKNYSNFTKQYLVLLFSDPILIRVIRS